MNYRHVLRAVANRGNVARPVIRVEAVPIRLSAHLLRPSQNPPDVAGARELVDRRGDGRGVARRAIHLIPFPNYLHPVIRQKRLPLVQVVVVHHFLLQHPLLAAQTVVEKRRPKIRAPNVTSRMSIICCVAFFSLT